MSSSKTRSVLQCISEYRQPAVKRKSESLCGAASAPQLNCMCCSLLTFRRPPAGADIDQRKAERGLLCAEHQIPQAVSSDVPAEQPTSSSTAALPAKVRTASFYGANKLLLVDQRVARLYASIQQRLHNLHNAPFEHFALQRQAFAWAEAHDLATDLKCVYIVYVMSTLELQCRCRHQHLCYFACLCVLVSLSLTCPVILSTLHGASLQLQGISLCMRCWQCHLLN